MAGRCGTPLKPYDNIPIVSYLILRGRCRHCGARISARYPAVEALTAILFAAVTWHDGLSFALAFDLAFIAVLVALVFIDAEHMILPNVITYPGIIFALLTRVLVPYIAAPSHFDDLPQLMTAFPTGYRQNAWVMRPVTVLPKRIRRNSCSAPMKCQICRKRWRKSKNI